MLFQSLIVILPMKKIASCEPCGKHCMILLLKEGSMAFYLIRVLVQA